MMKWRLGIDIGTNSCGWAVITLDEAGTPQAVQDLGVRIFPHGLSDDKKATLASERTIIRGIRNSRDRKNDRQRNLADILVSAKLLPAQQDENLRQLCPYELRTKAVMGNSITQPYHLGRALLHLGKRRGFLSNRKTDGGDDKDNTELKKRMSHFENMLEKENLTLAQYLHHKKTTYRKGDKPPSYQHTSNVKIAEPIRFKAGQEEFPTRQLYQDEFTIISKNYVDAFGLNQKIWDKIDDAIFYQRPLKPQERGKCQFYPNEERANRNLPIVHQIRILQEINNLRIMIDNKTTALTPEQRQIALDVLNQQKEVKFTSLRKKMKLPEHNLFNLESDSRQKLKGNEIACDMRKIFKDAGADWDDWQVPQQNDFVQKLLDAERDEQIETLIDDYRLPHDVLHALEGFYRTPAYASVSRKFIEAIYPHLAEGLRYDEATEKAGFKHSAQNIASHDSLEYYGKIIPDSTQSAKSGNNNPDNQQAQLEQQYGRIPNPTVHIALNQLRKVINALIEKYGKPTEIHIELARDIKNSKKQLQEINKGIASNTKANEARREIFKQATTGGDKPSRDDLLKIRLWEELHDSQRNRQCIYSGKPILRDMLFTGEVQIEHIIPYSLCFNDHPSNLTLSLHAANQLKGNRTPFEAFGSNQHKDKGYIWQDILQRAENLPKTKQKKFSEDMGEKYRNDAEGKFLQRQLIDTQYMARMARIYLASLTDGELHRVVAVNGGMTALLRDKWRLNQLLSGSNQKSRNDHAHHALDALVVALCDRAMIQNMARFSAMAEDKQHQKHIQDRLPVPLPEILQDCAPIKHRLDNLLVSYKPDHGMQGAMFQDKAYGLKLTDEEKAMGYNGVTRASIQAVLEKNTYWVRDLQWRQAVSAFLQQAGFDDKKRPKAKEAQDLAQAFAEQYHIKKLRVLIKNQSMEKIPSAPYKGYAIGKYAFCVIWSIPPYKGSDTRKGNDKVSYKVDFIAYRHAQRFDPQQQKPHPAAKMMKLFKNDYVLFDYDKEKHEALERDSHQDAEKRLLSRPYNYQGKDYLLCRVIGFSTTNNRIALCYHRAANPKQSQQGINILMKLNMRKVYLDEAGHLLL